MTNLYEILGIGKDATPEEIKKAYKAKAKELHPDKEGGNEEAFKRVAEAYAVLSDATKRSRYDSTGEYGVNHDFQVRFTAFVQGVLMPLIRMERNFNKDMFSLFKEEVERQQNRIEEQIPDLRDANKKLQEFLDRVKKKDGSESMLIEIVKGSIAGNEKQIEARKAELDFLHQVKQELDGHQYDFDLSIGSSFDDFGKAIRYANLKTARKHFAHGSGFHTGFRTNF